MPPELKRLPWWVWLLEALGFLLVLGGAFADGYLQGVVLEIGAGVVLVLPLVMAQRNIEKHLKEGIEEAVKNALVNVSTVQAKATVPTPTVITSPTPDPGH